MQLDAAFTSRLRARLVQLYGKGADAILPRLLELVQHHAALQNRQVKRGWDERDVILITYGDQLSRPGETPLHTLRQFLVEHGLDRLMNTIHLLPFYPHSSDDGFSVIDYRAVDPALGDWHDIHELGRSCELMLDLVLNHISRHSDWFQRYLAGDEKYARYFIEVPAETDLSNVTRPRSLPLLTPFETSRGVRQLWTTFSPDQLDLDYSQPDVLLDMIDVLLHYVGQGARIIRLDAVAYLWKELGTSCIHLPQTHTVVKLMRDVLDALAPGVLLVTETNVPHAENISYFGQGDEAHMVYQFSLPPLLLDAYLARDAHPLADWLRRLEPTARGMTFFNFTASHDGIGVRPLEGLVCQDRFQRLLSAVTARGGMVSTRHNPDGSESPYELNVTYLSALDEPGGLEPHLLARRFLASQGIMLALRGIPGIYFHSLVGTANDHAGVEVSGQARRINRRKFSYQDLERALATEGSVQQLVFRGYQHLLATRIAEPAFHPDGDQQILETKQQEILAFKRVSLDGTRQILAVANFDDQPKTLDLRPHFKSDTCRDVLSGVEFAAAGVQLQAYQLVWLQQIIT